MGQYYDGERKCLAFSCDGTCMIFDGKQTFQREINRNKAGEKLQLKLSMEAKLLGGSSFYLGQALFQRVHY